jgi:hypothetical protein
VRDDGYCRVDDTDIDVDTRPFLDNNSSNNSSRSINNSSNNNNSSSSSSCSKGSMQSTDMTSMTKGTPLGTVDLSYIEFITIAPTDVQSEDGDGDGNGDRSERHLTNKWEGLGRDRDGNRDTDMDRDRDRGRKGVRKDGTSPHRDGSSPKGGAEEPAPSGRCFPIGTENLDLGTESGNGKQSGDSSSGSSSRMSDPRSRDNSPLLQCTDLTGEREFSGQFTCFFIF